MTVGAGVLQLLTAWECAQIYSAYRPKTVKAQLSHFTTFLEFLEYAGAPLKEVDHVIVIAFIELLIANGL